MRVTKIQSLDGAGYPCDGNNITRQLSSYFDKVMATLGSRSQTVTGRVRADGRRQLLVYVEPEVIKNTKKAALDLDTTASAIVELALSQWLDRRGSNKIKKR